MPFSFGGASTAAAAAPTPASGGGFTFGSTPAAPAATAPAPAAAGGFSFGGTTATTAASAVPAPATGGFSFGGSTSGTTTAPTAPAPGLSAGFSFGGTPTAAPGTTAATAAATAPVGGGFSFGGGSSNTTSSTGASTGTSLFGPTSSSTIGTGTFQQQQQLQQQQLQPQHAMTSNTPFKALPPNAQKIIDDIYNLMHQHEQTMSSVSTMQPSSLQQSNVHTGTGIDGADVAAGTASLNHQPQLQHDASNATPLAKRISSLLQEMKHIRQNLEQFNDQSNVIFHKSCNTLQTTYNAGVYPLQSTAARMGITHEHLPDIQSLYHLAHSASDVAKKLNVALLTGGGRVDYVEGMPSVYLWEAMEDLNGKVLDLGRRVERLEQVVGVSTGQQQLQHQSRLNMMMMVGFGDGGVGGVSPGDVLEDLSLVMNEKAHALVRVAASVAKIQQDMEFLRSGFKEKILREKFHTRGGVSVGAVGYSQGSASANANVNARGLDPFAEADEREREYERRLEMEAQKRAIEAAASIATGQQVHPQTTPASAAPAAPTSLFSSTPAPGGGLFGSTTTLTPAPPSGGLFGSTTPAPAAGGGLFGSTPATPAPPSGGLFGSTTPAPSTGVGGGFGSTLTPAAAAPVAGGGLFGSTTATPAPAFGATASTSTAAAPAGGLFGAAPAAGTTSAFSSAPAPSGGFSFSSSSSSTTSTSRSRRKQSGRKR